MGHSGVCHLCISMSTILFYNRVFDLSTSLWQLLSWYFFLSLVLFKQINDNVDNDNDGDGDDDIIMKEHEKLVAKFIQVTLKKG